VKAIILALALWCAAGLAFADDSYFPIKTNAGGEGVTAFRSKWYGESLERMNEPRLPELVKDVKAEVYRIMILPSWGNPIVVRVQKHGELYSLSARRLDGQGGYDPGKLVEAKDIELGMSQECFSLFVFSFLRVDSLHSSRAASVAILPSALLVERFSLGAWWAFPLQ
jgi:hypothetical protein